MSNYTIIEGINVTERDISEALALDRIVYDEDYYVSLEQCLAWNQRNNRIYTMIRDEESDRIIAYVNLSPVTDEYYKKIKSGEFVDTYLPPEAIVSYDIPDLYNLYFSSIVIHPEYQHTKIFITLFNAIAQKLIELGNEEILINKMVADAVSDNGVHLCVLFGMTKDGTSNHNSSIYEVQLLPPQFRVSSKAAQELFSFYSEKAKDLGMKIQDKPAETTIVTAQAKNKTNSEINRKNGTASVTREVFISYSSKEMEIAGQVCEFLEGNGISCWIAPRNIDPGANYATQIVKAIRSCSILVLLASESTNESGHVSNEVSLAFDNKKTIIPLKLQNLAFSDEYLYFLGRKHWIEAYLDMKSGLAQLLSTIRSTLANCPEKSIIQNEKSDETVLIPPVPSKKEFDRAEKIAYVEYSKDGIVKCIIDRSKKYTCNFTGAFEDEAKFSYLKLIANELFAKCIKTYRYNKPKEVKDYVDYLVDELLCDDDKEVIKISGLPGIEKKILMQMSFYKTLTEFKNGNSKYLPFYISLGYYEEARYDEENVYGQVKALMTKEMLEYLTYIEKNDVCPILFIDDIREHNIGKIALENVLMDILKEKNIYKRVVSLDCGLVKNKNRLKRFIPIVSERVSALFEFHAIDADDGATAKRFVELVLKFYNYEIAVGEVLETIQSLRFQEIDMYIVKTLALDMLDSMNKISSISDLYEKWALTELYGDAEKLLSISKSASDYIFDNDYQLDNVNFYDSQWKLIHRHQTYLDLLISYYFIKRIEECDEQEEFDCDFFKIMLTASTDIFIGSFLKDNYDLQEKTYNVIIKYYDTFEVVQKSSATFWLTKLSYRNLITDATAFLRPRFDELKSKAKKSDNTTQENYDIQFYFRSLSLALIVFGQTSVLDEYLCLLITNDSANAINRGALVEYYSDQHQMAANESYFLDTDILAGAQSIKALIRKMNVSLKISNKAYPEKDMIALSMLLQMRVQSSKGATISELQDWVRQMQAGIKKYQTRPQTIQSEKIKFYFQSVYDDYEVFLNSMGRFDISQTLYNTLRNLRDVKRKQWTNNSISDPESISEHSYSSWMLAMLFLPSELNYEDYSKQEIMDMLLIHDMAEAKLGDQLQDLNEPSKALREQNVVMRKLMVKGSYPNVANLTYYYNVWTGYYNGTNTNSKIARDINLIQTVYTFCEYSVKYPENFSDEDRKMWMNEKNKLETDIGYSIYEKLVENNLDFIGAFEGINTPAANKINKDTPSSAPVTASKFPIEAAPISEENIRVMSYDNLIDAKVDISAIKSEIAAIAESIFSESDNNDLTANLKLLDYLTENWRVLINEDNVLVGYWVFVALQENYFEQAKSGILNEKDITLETIEFIDFPGTYKGYLLMSGTKPEFRTAATVQLLYSSLAIHLQYLAGKAIFFDEICAVAESPMGISAMKKLGLTEIAKHNFGGKVLACDMSKISGNKFFNSFTGLSKLYSQHFSNEKK